MSKLLLISIISIIELSLIAESARAGIVKQAGAGQEIVADCKWGFLWTVLKCNFPSRGPYGFDVGMDADVVEQHLVDLFESGQLPKYITASKVVDPTGGSQSRRLANNENLGSDIRWADYFSIDYRFKNKDGYTFYKLRDGQIYAIEWEWGVDLP